MLSKKDIEEILALHPWLRPPKYIYILDAPVIYPELKAKVLGMNPAFERETIILSRDATPETVVHETLHVNYMGELVAYPFGKILTRFRQIFPPIIKREVRYRERKLSSSELRKYGLYSYKWQDGYKPARLEVTVLELVDNRLNLQYRYAELPKACRCSECGYIIYNPGKHCREIAKCPRCGAEYSFWRVK